MTAAEREALITLGVRVDRLDDEVEGVRRELTALTVEVRDLRRWVIGMGAVLGGLVRGPDVVAAFLQAMGG